MSSYYTEDVINHIRTSQKQLYTVCEASQYQLYIVFEASKDIHTLYLKLFILVPIINYTGCPKKNETQFLLNISATKYKIFKMFFSPEN